MSRAKQVLKKGVVYFTGGLIATAVCIATMAIGEDYTVVSAASSHDYDTCVNGLTYNGASVDGASISSIRYACSKCTNGGSARGTLWFNDSATSPDGNVVRIDSWSEDIKYVRLWGAVYSCGQGAGVDNWGYHVWIGMPGQMKGDGTTISDMEGVADFFDLTQSAGGQGVYAAVCRGKISGYKYQWSDISNGCTTPANVSGMTYSLPNVAAFYPKKFREAAMNAGGCENIVEGGVTKLKCTMEVSVNRCFDNGFGKYKNTTNTQGGKCYGDPSELVLIAPPYTEGGFSSKSKVESGSDSKESPNWDQDAETLEVEADSSGNATVNFSHIMQYEADATGGNYNNAESNWTITIDDGSGGPWTGTYSTPGGVNNVMSNWIPNPVISTTVNLGTADEKTVCSTISYTPKTVEWDNNDPRSMKPNTDPNNKGQTKACAKIVRSETETVGQIEFWSQSSVTSVAANDVKSHTAETIAKTTGDKVTLRLSTDYPTAQADFSHKISYEIKLNGYTINANDTVTYDNMCTTWTIESDTSANGESKKFCASSYYTGESTVSTTSGHTINIASPGGEASAQEKITYKKKVVPILRKEKKKADGSSYDPKRYEYYAEANTGSGQGDSTARIEYVRPNEPDGDGPYSNGAGSADSSPMYAGEAIDQMHWTAHVKPSDTRRVMEFQSVAFLSQVSRSLSGSVSNTKGGYDNPNPRYPNRTGQNEDPCTFWRNRLGPLRSVGTDCSQVTSKAGLNQTFPDGSFDEAAVKVDLGEVMAVPDYVGDKYCNSFGYKFEYYYGVKNSKAGDTFNWTPDNQPYWVHYNAACRTIAKKPSIALWNGGLFAGQGNVSASTSPRYNSPSVGQATNAASDLRRFGSWTEYLANVNGSVGSLLPGVIPGVPGSTGLFSSGAAFAWNGSVNSEAIKNSPLTIQNVNSSMLGFSGVDSNSALLDRLEAYFKTAATNSESTIGNISGLTDSRIYYVNGDVTINGPISIASSADSVYQIPQVVIFATGSINITENVDRIDAWLISKNGKVDTCTATNLVDNSTQASVDGNNYNLSTVQCQKKLIINGPVFAKTITADRSFGSDGTSNNDTDPVNTDNIRAVPAEVFNLSAENYLWAYAQAGRYNSSYTEAYSRELPPRY